MNIIIKTILFSLCFDGQVFADEFSRELDFLRKWSETPKEKVLKKSEEDIQDEAFLNQLNSPARKIQMQLSDAVSLRKAAVIKKPVIQSTETTTDHHGKRRVRSR